MQRKSCTAILLCIMLFGLFSGGCACRNEAGDSSVRVSGQHDMVFGVRH